MTMKKNLGIDQFSEHLFWDVQRNKLSLEASCSYIIKQVLEYGLMNDWIMVFQYYGLERITNEAKSFRELEPKALSFIALLSGQPKSEFRCYTYQQSTPQHWNF